VEKTINAYKMLEGNTGKRELRRHKLLWEDKIKTGINEIRSRWTGFIWLRTETSGGLL
jgi:hypothetical protein